MEHAIHIILRYDLATGDVNLNEIVYRLKELKNPLMRRITEKIIQDYDDLNVERLSSTDIYPSKSRKGLGRHIRKGDPERRFCRGRKVRKRGYRKYPRKISSVFGELADHQNAFHPLADPQIACPSEFRTGHLQNRADEFR